VLTRRPLLVFGALSGMMASGYGVIFTVLDEYRSEYGIGETALGAIIGIGFISAFFAQILLAPLADRGMARRMMLVGIFFNLIGLVVMAMGTSVVPLLVGRFIMGMGIGAANPAIRRIVIVADPENVGQSLGRLLSFDVSGFAFGPVISAVLVGPFGIAAPFLVVATVTTLWAALIIRAPVDETMAISQASLALDLLKDRVIAGAVIMGSAVFVMIGAFDALWAVALDDLDAADWIANLGITLFALPLIFFGPAGGRLAQRIGPFRIATAGLLAGAGFMAGYGLAPSVGVMFTVAMVHALSDGLTVASTSVAVALATPDHRQAGGQGVLGGAQTLAAGITAVVVGAIYENSGRGWAYGVTAIAMTVIVLIGARMSRSAWRGAGNAPKGDKMTAPSSSG